MLFSWITSHNTLLYLCLQVAAFSILRYPPELLSPVKEIVFGLIGPRSKGDSTLSALQKELKQELPGLEFRKVQLPRGSSLAAARNLALGEATGNARHCGYFDIKYSQFDH